MSAVKKAYKNGLMNDSSCIWVYEACDFFVTEASAALDSTKTVADKNIESALSYLPQIDI